MTDEASFLETACIFKFSSFDIYKRYIRIIVYDVFSKAAFTSDYTVSKRIPRKYYRRVLVRIEINLSTTSSHFNDNTITSNGWPDQSNEIAQKYMNLATSKSIYVRESVLKLNDSVIHPVSLRAAYLLSHYLTTWCSVSCFSLFRWLYFEKLSIPSNSIPFKFQLFVSSITVNYIRRIKFSPRKPPTEIVTKMKKKTRDELLSTLTNSFIFSPRIL